MGGVERRDGWVVLRRLRVLDEMRGVAALAVLVDHTAQAHLALGELGPLGALLTWLGSWGVGLFFLLSGFCIHLPRVRQWRQGEGDRLRWDEFFRRRAWRILPTHYAALLLAVVTASFVESSLLHAPTWPAVLAQLAMVHTLFPGTFHSINAVTWSVGVEVHFYLAYPLYVRVARRVGLVAPAVLALVGLAFYWLASTRLAAGWRLVGQHFFLVTWWQWALGAAAADLYVSGRVPRWLGRLIIGRGRLPAWGAASLAIGLVDPVVAGLHVKYWVLPIACVLVLLSAVVSEEAERGESWAARLGAFSYSLYLIHPIALAVLGTACRGLPWYVTAAGQVASAIALAYGFYLLVERRFVSASRVVTSGAAPQAIGTGKE